MLDTFPADFHAFVTGTSGAIGGELVRSLRRRYPQAKLTLVDRDGAASEKLAGELGGQSLIIPHDLTNISGLPEVMEQAVSVNGPVALLVNCAGIMDVRSLEGTPWDAGERVLVVDYLAPMRLMSLCAAPMAASRRGAIVNISSMAGRVRLKGCAYYGSAKAGLAMASEVAREELKPKNVHVLTVYPGPVYSALERGARQQYGGGRLAKAMPTGDPAELAKLILDGVEKRKTRVVYPPVYGVGYALGDLAANFTLSVGPKPEE
ncbi:MAG: SDR family NAD(P)-dependent oxidoreductase [Deltaproteobacteria bacterium]|nr:SDR family NAD(P)-dependent oxidoreductase [Deltaproteobacteria bacterium]